MFSTIGYTTILKSIYKYLHALRGVKGSIGSGSLIEIGPPKGPALGWDGMGVNPWEVGATHGLRLTTIIEWKPRSSR